MLFEKNCTLQKWSLTNMAAQKNGALLKTHLPKKLWSWDFKVELFPL